MAEKKPKAKLNQAGGYDLLTERDGGNEILILTGKRTSSIKYWVAMRDLSIQVLNNLVSIENLKNTIQIESEEENLPKEITV